MPEGDSGTPVDSGVKPDTSVNPGKDAGMEAGGDAGKLDGYYAWGHPGAPNRLFIYYADAQNDLCFAMRLETPGPNMSAVTLPMGWDIKSTLVFQAAAACTPYYSGSAQTMQNLSSSGSITFSGTNVPMTIFDMDVTLNFMPSWAPGSQQLKTQNLQVTMF